MTAANSGKRAHPRRVASLPAPPDRKSDEYPLDCVMWSPVMEGVLRFEMGNSNLAVHGKRWCRKIFLRPTDRKHAQTALVAAADHDRVATFIMMSGRVFRISLTGSTAPRRRFWDYGPHAVIVLFSDDRVTRMQSSVGHHLVRDIPRVDGTVVVVTWNQLRQTERCRRVVVVPNLVITWPST